MTPPRFRHRSHPKLLKNEADLPSIVAEQTAALLAGLAERVKRGDVTPPTRIALTVEREREQGLGDIHTLLDSDADFIRFFPL